MILTPCKVVIIISYINVKTEKNMMEFKVKAYGKSELAMLYFQMQVLPIQQSIISCRGFIAILS